MSAPAAVVPRPVRAEQPPESGGVLSVGAGGGAGAGELGAGGAGGVAIGTDGSGMQRRCVQHV